MDARRSPKSNPTPNDATHGLQPNARPAANGRLTFLVRFALLIVMVASAGAVQAGTLYHYPSGSTAATIAWPADGQWVALSALNDPNDGLSNTFMDFVGDATNPGFYTYRDTNYIFFRIRVRFAGTVTAGGGNVNGSIFLLMETTGDGKPDFAFTWDAKSADPIKHGLEMQVQDLVGAAWSTIQMKDLDGNAANKVSPPDFSASLTLPVDGGIRTVDSQSTTNFGLTTFVDIAVRCAYLDYNADHGFTPTAFRCGQLIRYQLGSIDNATDHNALCGSGGDIAGGQSCSSIVVDGWPAPTAAQLFARQAATRHSGEVTMRWRSSVESDVAFYEVCYATRKKGPYAPVGGLVVRPQGNNSEYCATFQKPLYGRKVYYRVRATTFDGSVEWAPLIEADPVPSGQYQRCR